MDPNACLARLIDAAVAGDVEALLDAAGDFGDWIEKGGFSPDDPRKEQAILPESVPADVQASLARSRRRELLAVEIAQERFAGDDDVQVDPPDEDIEYVDGGYWIGVEVFVTADAVEERLGPRREYLTVRYEVTDLDRRERGLLALAAVAQSESDKAEFPGCPSPEVEWDVVDEVAMVYDRFSEHDEMGPVAPAPFDQEVD